MGRLPFSAARIRSRHSAMSFRRSKSAGLCRLLLIFAQDTLNERIEIAAREKMAREPRRRGCFKVGLLVADDKAARGIDRPMLDQVEDHPGLRLSPIMLNAKFRDGSVRMMRSVAEVIDPC